MEPLLLKETPTTPYISLDPQSGKFEISGNSLPEEVLDFYSLTLKWVKDYIENPANDTMVDIRLVYFNSSSSKAILDVLGILEELVKKGCKIEINWYYLEIDEDMLSTGREFANMLKIPFNFYTYIQE